jgi:hypothetical protein
VRGDAGSVPGVKTAGRLLLLAGACGLALSVLLPWVTVKGPGLSIDLGIVGAKVSSGSRTVAGIETSVWPVAVGLAALVAVVTLLGFATRLLAIVGVLVTLAGAALLYYCANVLDIETSGSSIKRLISDAVLTSSTGPGPPLVLASGIAILAGALLS